MFGSRQSTNIVVDTDEKGLDDTGRAVTGEESRPCISETRLTNPKAVEILQ